MDNGVMDDIEPKLISKGKARYKQLHESILGEISAMLKTAKIEPMHNLSGLNPSFISLVEDLELYRKIIQSLIETLGISARNLDIVDEYLALARKMAEAIDNECSDSLGAAIAALDEKPYI